MTDNSWGSGPTQFFYAITPEQVLRAVETSGVRCTGRCLALNSMENRVYEVEIEVDDPAKLRSPSARFRIVKFYRPGRWSQAQILEEHQFLHELHEHEIAVVPPLPFADGRTLHKMPDSDIYFALFAKMGGRIPDELSVPQLEQMGRLLARLHNVGASKNAATRLQITPQTYGLNNLNYLTGVAAIPAELSQEYSDLVRRICDLAQPWFAATTTHRLHGDCHLGNILWSSQGATLVDFDDMLIGPAVQDIWLMLPGRDEHALQQRAILLEAYESMRDFDHRSLRLVEVLRALRFIHFSAWINKRWQDPAFPRAFPQFADKDYWPKQLHDLREQWQLISSLPA